MTNPYYDTVVMVVNELISKYGIPNDTSISEMLEFAQNSIRSSIGILDPPDVTIEIDNILRLRFYKARCHSTLARFSNHTICECSLSLTNQQLDLYDQYEYLVPVTVSCFMKGKPIDHAIGTDDLLQYGRIALVRAIQTCTSLQKLKPYAISLIRSALSNAIHEMSDRISIEAHLSGFQDNDGFDFEHIDFSDRLKNKSFASAVESTCTCIDILMYEASRSSGNRKEGILCYIKVAQGFTPKEIALAEGISLTHITKCMRIAREYLRKSNYFRSSLCKDSNDLT